MAVEIAAQLPEVATVYVAAGGGGMLSGTGAVLRAAHAPGRGRGVLAGGGADPAAVHRGG